ncbi:Aldehyde/histidinol dehydrogenase [Mucor mucedo]|uniref:Aldehyde/histidinol dehydrogenase n=1 Tax=Mucor mucedo TaxID=29922 RepID=UPI00221E9A4D|nr:Aldehyde/histidinol dehydrogenase [Mucor mucedo]KAI7877077.1 Aldehyde/histidinol dehydrogenase [Mucor mucedo]
MSDIKFVSVPKLSNPELLKQKAFIDNEWVDSSSGQTFDVQDPATGEIIGNAPDCTKEDTVKAIKAAEKALETWSQTTAKERHDYLIKLHQTIMANQEDLGIIITRENGKILEEAKGEVEYGSSFFEWFAEEAVRSNGTTLPQIYPTQRTVTITQPVGVVSIVCPWNFPMAMIARKVGAAFAAGCTVIIKPASETPYSALAVCEIAKKIGIPAGVINVVTTHENVKDVGLELASNPIVRKISFTGSTGTGKLLMSQASDTMKKVSMELGGNAAFIVFDDADIDAAVEGAIPCKFKGTGQTCICANRFYIHKSVYDEFATKLTKKISELKIGHGFDKEATHGPLINDAAIEKITKHVKDAVEKGAQIKIGGKQVGDHFFQPTLLTGMTDDMVITTDETFGPIAALYSFEDEKDVIKRANATPFGLAGYFYSRDIGRVWRVAEKIQTGMVGVNTPFINDCYAPFGGIKESGLGIEGSHLGLDDYIVNKTIHMGL